MSLSTKTIMPLTLENISYLAGHKKLLKNISCKFEAGKRYVVLGPNGAGKSLLLRMCHGLIQPSEGLVKWHDISSKDAAKYQAMVSQRTVMLRRSAYGNIDFALKARKIPKQARPDIIEHVIKRTGLSRIINEPARVLSLGEQQRLAIARAWALSPLDQFSRNMFRNDPKAFASDEKARECLSHMLERGFDKELSVNERKFTYLPLEHSEDVKDQEKAIACYTELGDELALDYAQQHKVIIDRFGRFPHRNKVLGRVSTEEEIEFLEQPGSSF